MHHTRKKKALALIGDQTDPIAITKLLLDNEFTDEEATEVIGSLTDAAGEDDKEPLGQSPAPVISATAPATTTGKKSKYSQYDLWQIEVGRSEKRDPVSRQSYVVIESFTAIKPIRKGVKLESQVVNDMNAQSHNSLRRYYLSGSITNGNTEKVDITTASTDAK